MNNIQKRKLWRSLATKCGRNVRNPFPRIYWSTRIGTVWRTTHQTQWKLLKTQTTTSAYLRNHTLKSACWSVSENDAIFLILCRLASQYLIRELTIIGRVQRQRRSRAVQQSEQGRKIKYQKDFEMKGHNTPIRPRKDAKKIYKFQKDLCHRLFRRTNAWQEFPLRWS
jgi:hypothetical protein